MVDGELRSREKLHMMGIGMTHDPIEIGVIRELRDALDKLKLNDAALIYEPETSVALGFGFRCGFLGLPHTEIVSERLDQLKSRTKGYASLDYHEDGEQSADLVKVDILIQGEKVDAFSAIVHRDKA